MKINQLTTPKNYLYEGLDASNLRSVKLWESAGRKLVEYQMTPDQISQLFAQVQQNATAAGSNRTMIGKGKDAVDAVNNAWEDLKTKVQNSGPIKNVDATYDQAAAKLKQATGGDAGVMKYVEKYRKFAKEHPVAQSLIYAALIAAAGISGAGAGGAAALGLFKMTDKLLQGEKFSSAAYAGAKTGALAYGASHLADYFKNPNTSIPPKTEVKMPDGTDYVVQKGDTLSQIAQKNGVSVDDLMKANSGQSIAVGGPTADPAFTQVDTMGNYTGTATDPADIVTRTKLTNPDVLKPGQNLFVPTSAGPTPTYQGGVGTAADTWDKIKSGVYDPSQISANQAAKYNLPGAVASPDATGAATKAAKGVAKGGYDAVQNAATQAAINAQSNPDWNDEIGQRVAGAGNLAGAQSPKAQFPTGLNPRAKIGMREAKRKTKLSETQIKRMFYVAGTLQDKLTEGVWDKIKGAASKAAGAVANKAQTVGTNLTTKVTADKLMTAWKKAGSPTDSDAVAAIMKQAGVDDAIIASSMKAVGGQSAPANTTTPAPTPTDATTPANTTPAPVDAQTQKFIQQLVASYQALTPAEKATLKKELEDAVTASDVGGNVVKGTMESRRSKKRVR
jgi:LysM repeat protein